MDHKFLLFSIIFISGISVFGINQIFADQESDCVFTADIEKSWVFFGDRPWIIGSVINCDPESGFQFYSSNDEGYYKKDRVFVRILDINGDLLKDGSHKKKDLKRYSDVELSTYKLSYQVDRSDKPFYQNIENNRTQIRPNQFFFYLPQIQSMDFEHRGVYQIELTYGDHTRTIWFATLNPDLRWDEKESNDTCLEEYKKELNRLNKMSKVFEDEITRFEKSGEDTKLLENRLNETQKQIKSLKKC